MSSTESETPTVFDPMWAEPPTPNNDLREISCGDEIPVGFYADQPYLTKTADGGLLCVVTTGIGQEGSRGQHVLAMKTFDQGKTWENIQPVENPQNPESSWGVPLLAPSGRLFVFYIYNADDIRELAADNPPYPSGTTNRMDSHGHYVFRWSDDHGKTWSKERGSIPVREFEIDHANPTGGRIRLFWNVGKAFEHENQVFLPLHKVGGFGDGWFTSSEGALLRSDDLFTLEDPLQANWSTLPDGDVGIRAPAGGGSVAEEQSFTTMSDGSFFTVFRTIDGHPGCGYSRDQGQSWEPSQYMQFADGRLMKHPRAANFVWKRSDGGYLYCFHNHGGKPLREREDRRTFAYNGRNPMWFCRGREVETSKGMEIEWSQPEIGFYDDDPLVRISYPDYIEHDGQPLFTETQKSTARIHRFPEYLIDALSADQEKRAAGLSELEPLVTWSIEKSEQTIKMPELPVFLVRSYEEPYGALRLRKGFAVELSLQVNGEEPALLAESLGKDGRSFRLEWTPRQTLSLCLNDGQTTLHWESDPIPKSPALYRFNINVDGASNTISIFRDGAIDDGGEDRQYGWGRISPHYTNSCTGDSLTILDSPSTRLQQLTIFPRPLTAAEVSIRQEQQD